jgi:uncharacterized protein with von Willebrand factor type A (vWA) domain
MAAMRRFRRLLKSPGPTAPERFLYRKDFGELTAAELQQIKQFMAEIVWELDQRQTRRQKPGRGRRFDLRRSLRRNVRYGGEWLEWTRRQPKFKPRPLIIIADISGSMERYTRLLLQFIYSLAAGMARQVEAFVFSTRLTRITRQLRDRDVDHALLEVAGAVPDWAGGTRIGDALKDFNFYWGRRVLGRGAVVLLISDGWGPRRSRAAAAGNRPLAAHFPPAHLAQPPCSARRNTRPGHHRHRRHPFPDGATGSRFFRPLALGTRFQDAADGLGR